VQALGLAVTPALAVCCRSAAKVNTPRTIGSLNYNERLEVLELAEHEHVCQHASKSECHENSMKTTKVTASEMQLEGDDQLRHL
jgi:hypothetical protein